MGTVNTRKKNGRQENRWGGIRRLQGLDMDLNRQSCSLLLEVHPLPTLRWQACRRQTPAVFSLSVTFSGSWAGGSLEPAQTLKRDVATFQDTFINLPLVLQASENPGGPIWFSLHCMEVGRIYTTNKEGHFKRKGEGGKTYKVSLFNILLESPFVTSWEESCFLVSSSGPGLSRGLFI